MPPIRAMSIDFLSLNPSLMQETYRQYSKSDGRCGTHVAFTKAQRFPTDDPLSRLSSNIVNHATPRPWIRSPQHPGANAKVSYAHDARACPRHVIPLAATGHLHKSNSRLRSRVAKESKNVRRRWASRLDISNLRVRVKDLLEVKPPKRQPQELSEADAIHLFNIGNEPADPIIFPPYGNIRHPYPTLRSLWYNIKAFPGAVPGSVKTTTSRRSF